MKFSVITTCLNAEKSIKQTIDSVLSQKGDFELEYIITDAGSTDKTLEIIRSYKKDIVLIDATGANQSKGFNIGIEKSTGDILSFLNSDDTYYKNTLSTVLHYYNDNPVSKWFIGKCRIVDGSGNVIDNFITEYKALLTKHYAYAILLIENFVPHPTTFVKKEVFSKTGMYNTHEQYAMDYDLWLRIGKADKPIFINKYLATFKRDSGTKSNKHYIQQMSDDMRLGIKYAFKNRYLYTPIFKLIAFLRTIIIYKFKYR